MDLGAKGGGVILLPRQQEITHFHLFSGLGGGARGLNRGRASVGNVTARFRCLGGIDVDAAAIADFSRAAGVVGTVRDLFSREQYRKFHGQEPPDGWQQATPDDIRRAAGGERPNIVFGSAPCKGFSGLLSNSRAKLDRYQALNELAVRALWLALEAWGDDPPELWLWENVPRIATRGRAVVDRIVGTLEAYGYVVRETTHNCGELGGLSQNRNRFLLVARHREKVPPFLYEPPRRPVQSVGSLLDRFPLPSDPAAGPMHTMRSLQWRTWVRLAFVESGGDWRSLKKLRVVDGQLADFGIAPASAWFPTAYGVSRWQDPSATITSEARPSDGRFAVADPRPTWASEYSQYGVVPWREPAGTVSGKAAAGTGPYSVADPRATTEWAGKGKYIVVPFNQPANAVIAASATGNGAFAVADPRSGIHPSDLVYRSARHFGVVPWTDPTLAVTGSACHDNGAFSVADPRCAWSDGAHRNKLKVVGWNATAPSVIAATRVDSGALSVADPRDPLPAPADKLVAIIQALDGTWHRPFTTLELAALQGLVDPDEHLELEGASDTAWRERIGNAVPSPAAEAIASVMGETLLLAWAGETFALSATPVWVRPIAVALAVDGSVS